MTHLFLLRSPTQPHHKFINYHCETHSASIIYLFMLKDALPGLSTSVTHTLLSLCIHIHIIKADRSIHSTMTECMHSAFNWQTPLHTKPQYDSLKKEDAYYTRGNQYIALCPLLAACQVISITSPVPLICWLCLCVLATSLIWVFVTAASFGFILSGVKYLLEHAGWERKSAGREWYGGAGARNWRRESAPRGSDTDWQRCEWSKSCVK